MMSGQYRASGRVALLLTLALSLPGCAAVAIVSTAASVTTTAVTTGVKGVATAGRLTYRGARAVGRAVTGGDAPEDEGSAEPADGPPEDDRPIVLTPSSR